MRQASASHCPRCEQLQQQVQVLQRQQQQQQQTITSLLDELRQVKEKLAGARKNSSTSSKPPSSDLVKPDSEAATAESSSRPSGGQPGHPKHERAVFSPEQLTAGSHTYEMTHCPTCHTP